MVANVEMTGARRAGRFCCSAGDSAHMPGERAPAGSIRLTPARLTSRIVLLNIAGLIILVSGILYLNQFRQGLIDARVQSLLTQGQIIAAASLRRRPSTPIRSSSIPTA